MMIDEVMYGMIPSANTANWVSAPPEKSCRNPRTPPSSACVRRVATASRSMPGTGMNDPNRYRAIIRSVNSTLFRRSGIRKTLRKVPIAAGGS
jgi:hypothetical protein